MAQLFFSKWPIEKDFQVPLLFEEKDRYIKLKKNAAVARIHIHDRSILVSSAHLGVMISPQDRQEQVQAILDAIPTSVEACLIAEDFNTYG